MLSALRTPVLLSLLVLGLAPAAVSAAAPSLEQHVEASDRSALAAHLGVKAADVVEELDDLLVAKRTGVATVRQPGRDDAHRLIPRAPAELLDDRRVDLRRLRPSLASGSEPPRPR